MRHRSPSPPLELVARHAGARLHECMTQEITSRPRGGAQTKREEGDSEEINSRVMCLGAGAAEGGEVRKALSRRDATGNIGGDVMVMIGEAS